MAHRAEFFKVIHVNKIDADFFKFIHENKIDPFLSSILPSPRPKLVLSSANVSTYSG
jgi:hypothetical protein